MEAAQALQFLRTRFPDLSDVIAEAEQPDSPEPYYSYERFAEEVLRRKDDSSLLGRVYNLIDEMAASGDSVLEDLLAVSLLEALAQDRHLASEIRSHVSVEPRALVKAIESDVYGRSVE